MTSKKANWLFLTVVLMHIGTVLLVFFAGEYISVGIFMNFLLGQGIILVPTLVFWVIFECRYRRVDPLSAETGALLTPPPVEAAAFRRIKISTVLMIALCTILIMPLVAVLNALTLFFTDNTMVAMGGDILEAPFFLMWFMIGIFGPFCEEFVFRGVMYRSYRRSSGRGIAAVLLSAFIFGLMHMNFNQALYAFGIGIFLALLVEAAGSLWASVFCHMFFNSFQVVMMYLSSSILKGAYGQAVAETAQEITTQELMAALAVYLVIAAVTTPIAVCILAWIMKNEGRQEAVRALFYGSEGQKAISTQPEPHEGSADVGQPDNTQELLLSEPLIIAVVLSLGYMSLELFFMK